MAVPCKVGLSLERGNHSKQPANAPHVPGAKGRKPTNPPVAMITTRRSLMMIAPSRLLLRTAAPIDQLVWRR